MSFVLAVCLVFCIFTGGPSYSDMQGVGWKEVSRGIRDADIMRVVVSPEDSETAYASSLKSVYMTEDGGDTWKEVFSLRATGKTVNSLAVLSGAVFAGTSDGLLRSIDSGRQWEKIFDGVGERESLVACITVDAQDPDMIMIGTGSGMYRTENAGKNWIRGQNMPLGTLVTSLAIDTSERQTIYAAGDGGGYKSMDSGRTWQRIFVENLPERPEGTAEEDQHETAPTDGPGMNITSILTGPSDSKQVYMGTSSGLYVSVDSGLTWKRAGRSGIYGHNIRHIALNVASPDELFAATDKGVLRYSRDPEGWNIMNDGLFSDDIRYLSVACDRTCDSFTIWAAAENGVFKTVSQPHLYADMKDEDIGKVLSHFDHEPTIGEIRHAAIAYAEVQPEKIETWRKAAARKALLPDVRFEYQKDRSWQRGTYFYSNASEKYTDDDITHDRDRGWSISLTWDLGELIWNDDQTSIDSRSKLMVELRDDIVNEVTRLYFERRKVQIEMLTHPEKDFKERMERELRLQELTAGIDALTGSFLSKSMTGAQYHGDTKKKSKE